LPPDVALYLLNHKRDDLYRLESRGSLRLEVVPQPQMKVDQFEIEELRREEPDAVPMVTADAVDEAMVGGTLAPIHAPLTPVTLAPAGEPRGGEQRSSDPRGG